MAADDHLKYMRRCLDLAYKAEGMTFPNPMVGSVIVHKGKIIGEGYHRKSGTPHAEVLAINSVKDKTLLSSSELYVNLEPCSHFGKTPPCADLIISYKIPVIVVGTTDTSSKISGRGLSKLSDAGCNVVHAVAEEECRWINRRFFTFHEKKRPYITLKWAQSADGFIDIKREEEFKGGSVWITGKSERVLVHKWRASEQTILVGADTVRADNPMLNVREWKGNDPLRLILSGTGSLPAKLAMNDLPGSQVIFSFYPEKIKTPGSVFVQLNPDESSAVQILDYLYRREIQSIFIEGGAKTLTHFISSGLWDEARVFYGSQLFRNGVKAPEISGEIISKTKFSSSTLEILLNNS